MAKAQVISGLEAAATTRASLQAVFSVRIAELWGWSGFLDDPECVRELHDMRIAAKRLRYLFEIFEPCFGPGLAGQLVRFKRLQDYLGEIHDCDVWAGELCGLLKDVLVELDIECAALCRVTGAGPGLKLAVEEMLPHLAVDSARGLAVFIGELVDRRSALYLDLLDFWAELEDEDFREQLTAAVADAGGGGVGRP